MATAITNIEGCHLHRIDQDIGRDPRKGGYYTKFERVTEHPRLKRRYTIYSRLGLPDEIAWFADGEQMDSLEEALAWINMVQVPVVSITERTILDQIGDKWQAMPATPIHMASLLDKGLVEMEPAGGSRCRLSDLGRKVLDDE